jgi:hypothetical protein
MPPPPLLGYNNNVRHRGRIFHIQTEDSGVGSPRIKTHLFADGGRIVRSTRTDYSEHVGQPDMVEKVKNLMKEQHKAMFVALRSGELDETIGFEEALVNAVPTTSAVEEFAEREPDSLRASVRVAQGSSHNLADQLTPKAPAVAAPAQAPAAVPESGEGERPYAAPRPAAIFSVIPSSAGIFGDVGIDEKSLDDAILSYLAEDPPKKE